MPGRGDGEVPPPVPWPQAGTAGHIRLDMGAVRSKTGGAVRCLPSNRTRKTVKVGEKFVLLQKERNFLYAVLRVFSAA